MKKYIILTIFCSLCLSCGEPFDMKLEDEPVIYRKAMEFLGTDRGNTAVFEDALHAAQTAKADGFLTVGIFDPHIREQAQLRALCDCYLTDFRQADMFWKFASAQNR